MSVIRNRGVFVLMQVRVKIKGVVQGVGFRYFTRSLAYRYGITGFVRNLADGSVEVEASGPDSEIELFLKDIARGPSLSSVSGIDVEEIKAGDYNNEFKICF